MMFEKLFDESAKHIMENQKLREEAKRLNLQNDDARVRIEMLIQSVHDLRGHFASIQFCSKEPCLSTLAYLGPSQNPSAPPGKEFKIHMMETAGGGTFYAVIPMTSGQECSRCPRKVKGPENTDRRLVVFYSEVLGEHIWQSEICCAQCGDEIRDTHVQLKAEQDGELS